MKTIRIITTLCALGACIAIAGDDKASAEAPTKKLQVNATTAPAEKVGASLTIKERNRLLNRLVELRRGSQALGIAPTSEQKQIEERLRGYFAARRNAREAMDGQAPIIGHLATTKEHITIRNGSDGPRYEIRSKDGKTVLAKDLTDAQLQAFSPKLHRFVNTAYAGKSSRKGVVIDARVYPSAYESTSMEILIPAN